MNKKRTQILLITTVVFVAVVYITNTLIDTVGSSKIITNPSPIPKPEKQPVHTKLVAQQGDESNKDISEKRIAKKPIELEVEPKTPGKKKKTEDLKYGFSLKPSDFVKWIKQEKNGLVKRKTIQDITYTLTYLPSEFMACNELKRNEITSREMNDLKEHYKEMKYFQLKIGTKSGVQIAKYQLSSAHLYEERIKYFSFGMQNKLYATTDKQEPIPCTHYHFERTYNITPYSTFLLGFPSKDFVGAETITVVLEDNLFDNGVVKFSWQTKELNHFPMVKVKQ